MALEFGPLDPKTLQEIEITLALGALRTVGVGEDGRRSSGGPELYRWDEGFIQQIQAEWLKRLGSLASPVVD